MNLEELTKELAVIQDEILTKIKASEAIPQLNDIKVAYLSKKGPLKDLQTKLPTLKPEEKITFGQKINAAKSTIQSAYDKRQEELHLQEVNLRKDKNWIDVTIPGKKISIGHLHPITQLRREAENIFMNMGFEIVEPRSIDTDYNVFEALNIPVGHPARDMWDTFWTTNGYIPITHTSAMQHTILKEHDLPVRAIVPGRCFRQEATDATHEHTFYQIEGVYVDKNITLSDLIGTLKTFLSAFYDRDVQLRIQPSYFPFVEPGLEIMIDCAICKGKEGYCSTCRGKRWIELVPAGPIHPNVLTMAGIDPNEYSGFAWGMGLDRLVMIKYGIEDLRWFHSGDLRFLQQF
ncbi:phenylalanine--tRNA ligase subunit alpha [candidate division WWE3 bacterium]|uniref:Phenylalanine--tRNA ligase alpha subunit n=1 Tax=candidate division WWE3 bacterium TaxID=2053526 RepID=A0A955LGM0_UNCKA|nr:phenylalanine--tRNA ligase subunit alpha [candidate division WWE3 bacterium]